MPAVLPESAPGVTSAAVAGPRELALRAEALRGLAPGETARVAVSGRSMAPTLQPGDSLRVRRLEPSGCKGRAGRAGRAGHPRLGDLVVVELRDAEAPHRRAGLVVHRLLWLGGDVARTRGDGSGLMDPPVRREDLIGVVVAVERDGALVTPSAIRRRLSWLTCFAAAARHRLARRWLALAG